MHDIRHTLSDSVLVSGNNATLLGIPARTLAFFLLIIGFAIKLPIVPLHTWLPDAHVEASTPISIVLAGILLKTGGYGLLRVPFSIFPDQAAQFQGWIAGFAVFSILWAAFSALAQNDWKRMIAYSSVSHMGFALLGMASLTIIGWNGALFQLFSHGLISPMLFMLVGIIYHHTGSRDISHFSGLAIKAPIFAFFTGIAFFAGLGMPGLAGFIGEFLPLVGAYEAVTNDTLSLAVPILASLGLLLSAAYFLWAYQRVFLGQFFISRNPKEVYDVPVLKREEVLALSLLSLLILIYGIFPTLQLDISKSYIASFFTFTGY